MMSQIRLKALPFKDGCNPTPYQRAIYYFYDQKYSDEAESIYSTEWYDRSEQFRRKAKSWNEVLTTWDEIKEMDFASFFIAHPVAAFGVWKILQVCYTLDKLVCTDMPKSWREWETWPPYKYLDSPEIEQAWRKCLAQKKARIENRTLEGDELVAWLHELMYAFDQLRGTIANLQESFGETMSGSLAERMVTVATEVVKTRRSMVRAEIMSSKLRL